MVEIDAQNKLPHALELLKDSFRLELFIYYMHYTVLVHHSGVEEPC